MRFAGMAGWACLAAGLAAASGCVTNLAGTIFSPDFLDAVSPTGGVASIPGEAPALLVVVENRTTRVIETLVTWRDGDGTVSQRVIVLDPGEQQAEAVICPVEELTLGEVSDLTATGAVVRLGDGGGDDPIIQVEPFGVLLRDGANYDCGDRVRFTVAASGTNVSGYGISAFIQRSGL